MIFVTGGTGLLGSHLLVELSKKEEKITAIYRHPNGIQEVKELFNYYYQEQSEKYFQRIAWKSCDILNPLDLFLAMEGHEIVYHCAGMVSFRKRDFSRLIKANRIGTSNIVNNAIALGVKQLCYVSSIATLGEHLVSSTLITEENKWKLSPQTSGYSISKFNAEREVWRGINEGLNAFIVNPGIIIGAGKKGKSSLNMLRNPPMYPPGSTGFIDARDLSRIMVLLTKKGINNEQFICVGENASYRRFFSVVAQQLNKKLPRKKIPKISKGLIWRVAVLWATLTFSKSQITRETMQSGFSSLSYNNEKIKKYLPSDFPFRTIEEMIENGLRFQRKIKN